MSNAFLSFLHECVTSALRKYVNRSYPEVNALSLHNMLQCLEINTYTNMRCTTALGVQFLVRVNCIQFITFENGKFNSIMKSLRPGCNVISWLFFSQNCRLHNNYNKRISLYCYIYFYEKLFLNNKMKYYMLLKITKN